MNYVMQKEKSVFDETLALLTDKLQKEEKDDKTFEWTIYQLRYIFSHTEEAWYANLKRFKGDIKYLLICEAPPWSLTYPKYFYLQPKGQLFNTIWKVFFNGQPQKTPYDCLAKEGFLLIDSLPYSMIYKTKHRKSSEYLGLIKACMPWWLGKLDNSGLTFSKELKIAFGYYWNGKRIIEGCGGNIPICKNKYSVNESHIISHKGSRYLPDEKELKNVYKITKTFNCP